MHPLLLAAAVTGQAPQAGPPPSPVARIVVTPSETTLAVGDTVRLQAQALDSAGRPVPGAQVRFFGAFQGAVDEETGVVRAGSRGVLLVNVMALVTGRRPSRPAAGTPPGRWRPPGDSAAGRSPGP